MGFIWGLIAVILAVVVLVSIYDVVRRPLSGGKTAAWILLIVILPFIGSMLYWGLRRPTPEELGRAVDAEHDLQHTPPPHQRV